METKEAQALETLLSKMGVDEARIALIKDIADISYSEETTKKKLSSQSVTIDSRAAKRVEEDSRILVIKEAKEIAIYHELKAILKLNVERVLDSMTSLDDAQIGEISARITDNFKPTDPSVDVPWIIAPRADTLSFIRQPVLRK